MKRIIRSLMMASLLAVGVMACGGPSTSIEQQWRPSQPHASLRKVATVMLSKNMTVRRTAEDDMARRLHAAGIVAVPGYVVLRDSDYGNRDLARAKLIQQGFDGVVAMRLVSKEERLQYVPGTYDAYWGYGYGYGWGSPGYVESETLVRVETSVYSLLDQALVYTAISGTLNPEDVNSVIVGVTSTVAGEMRKQGVVAATRAATVPAG